MTESDGGERPLDSTDSDRSRSGPSFGRRAALKSGALGLAAIGFGAFSSGAAAAQTAEETNEAVVTNGDDLQEALNNNTVVRVSGVVEVSEPVTVPWVTSLYGYGVRGAGMAGDGVIGDFEGPVLNLLSNAQVTGIAVENQHPDGDGIGFEGWTLRIWRTDVMAGRNGIVDTADGNRVEARITNNRVTVNGHGAQNDEPGDVGIDTGGYHDCEVHNNIVRGFDTGVRINRSSCHVTNHHIYPHPVAQGTTSYGILVDEDAHWDRVNSNFVDGASVAAIEDRSGQENIYRDNWLWVDPSDLSDDLYGFNFTNWMNHCVVKGNRIWVQRFGSGEEDPTATRPINVEGEVKGSKVADTILPAPVGFDDPEPLTTEWRGRRTASGQAGKTTFEIPHGNAEAPELVQVTPASADAAGSFWVSDVSAESITIEYDQPPVSGSDNLVWNLNTPSETSENSGVWS